MATTEGTDVMALYSGMKVSDGMDRGLQCLNFSTLLSIVPAK